MEKMFNIRNEMSWVELSSGVWCAWANSNQTLWNDLMILFLGKNMKNILWWQHLSRSNSMDKDHSNGANITGTIRIFIIHCNWMEYFERNRRWIVNRRFQWKIWKKKKMLCNFVIGLTNGSVPFALKTTILGKRSFNGTFQIQMKN